MNGIARGVALAAAGLTALVTPAMSAEFKFDAKANDQWAKKLDMPVYMALPASARLSLPKTINTTDRLVEFKHPDGMKLKGDVGLRLVVTKRQGMSKRLAQSGLLQTGDILLTFRPEWGGGGAYPNIQMGISHTGLAYVRDGEVRQIDNPLNAEYLGGNMRGDFTSEHYRTLTYLHVIRPRNLTEAQKAALVHWASQITANARRIYPAQIAFNQDYNAPKYKPGKPLDFVQHVGQAGLGQSPKGATDLFCSEFVWSLLALRTCDPGKVTADFQGSGVPKCIKPAMTPMHIAGNYMTVGTRGTVAGLADGPLLVIDALKAPAEKRKELIHDVFVTHDRSASKMSAGHRKLAQEMQPKFAALEEYYNDASRGGVGRVEAWVASKAMQSQVPDNYSPTSFLVNTLLPDNNRNRVMDYVATLVLE